MIRNPRRSRVLCPDMMGEVSFTSSHPPLLLGGSRGLLRSEHSRANPQALWQHLQPLQVDSDGKAYTPAEAAMIRVKEC